MKKMRRVFLVHGWEGTPDNHWFPWLTHKLVAKGFTVFAPSMPDAAHPKVSAWLAELSRVVGVPDKDTYFVGHSLGCITVARYLATLPQNAKAGGCVFVAGFLGDINIPEIAEFYSLPLDIDKVKSRCTNFVTIYSDNDEFISLDESKDFSAKLGAKEILEEGKGHFSSELQPPELPIALEAILRMSTQNSKL